MTYYVKCLRDLREERKLTKKRLAEVLGTTPTMYARYERGDNELPIHHLITLCQFYRVSSDAVLGLDCGDGTEGS